MKLLPNDWNRIRLFYNNWNEEIFAAGRNEWGMDAYEWDYGGMIHFTPIETLLWHDIRANDAVLYPQYPVDRYFVDFANPVAKVAVECDGAAYHDADADAARDAQLRELGWTVYRITGSDCWKDFDQEQGIPSPGHLLIERICRKHGISRSSREAGEGWGDGAVSIDMLHRIFRQLRISAATRAGRRVQSLPEWRD